MKRSGRLQQRTPMKRGKRLRPMSASRQKVSVLRAEFVAEQLKIRPICEAGNRIGEFYYWHGTSAQKAMIDKSGVRYWKCTGRAIELHEPLTRARAPGSDTILDAKNSVAVCRECHRWIHYNPVSAELIGLLRHSWDAHSTEEKG